MRKNGLLTFIFACIPGTGQMYQGYMRRGVSLILLFALNIFVTSIIPIAGIFLPVIWAYSFFDTFHIHNAVNDAYASLKDGYLFGLGETDSGTLKNLFGKKHILIGSALVIAGGYMTLEKFIRPLLVRFWSDTDIYWPIEMLDSLPSFFVAAVLIGLGIYLVIGKRPNRKIEEDFIEYRGNTNNRKEEQR